MTFAEYEIAEAEWLKRFRYIDDENGFPLVVVIPPVTESPIYQFLMEGMFPGMRAFRPDPPQPQQPIPAEENRRMNLATFKAIGELAIGAKRRQEKEYADFIAFYRDLVENLPTEVTELFGKLDNIPVRRWGSGKTENVGLILSVADLLWWTHEFEMKTRFVNGISYVKSEMLARLSRQAETERLSPDERKRLLAILDGTGA